MRVTSRASGPTAAKEVCGWLLRRAPGVVRITSESAPMVGELGVRPGSKAGIRARCSAASVEREALGEGGRQA